MARIVERRTDPESGEVVLVDETGAGYAETGWELVDGEWRALETGEPAPPPAEPVVFAGGGGAGGTTTTGVR